LSLRLNECKLSASRTAAGRLFHTTGPATEKALSSGVTMAWLLRLVTGAPAGKGAPNSFRVLND